MRAQCEQLPRVGFGADKDHQRERERGESCCERVGSTYTVSRFYSRLECEIYRVNELRIMLVYGTRRVTFPWAIQSRAENPSANEQN